MIAERALADDFAGAADFYTFGGAFMRFEFGHKIPLGLDLVLVRRWSLASGTTQGANGEPWK